MLFLNKKARIQRNAERCVAQGKTTNAIAEYQKLIAADPNDLMTINMLGDLYVKAGRVEDAIHNFTRIAEHYRENGYTVKAIAMYKKISKLNVDDADVAGKLAVLYSQQGLIVEARQQYLSIAETHARNNDITGAFDIYQKIADLEPENTNIRIKLGELCLRVGQQRKAHDCFIAAGQELGRRGRFEESLNAYLRALAADRTSRSALQAVSAIYVHMGEPLKAVDLLNRAFEDRPGDVELLTILGKTYLAGELLDEAEATLLSLVQIDASKYEYLLELGRRFMQKGLFDRAAEQIDGCLDIIIGQRSEEDAVGLLHEILKKDINHLPSLERLVDIYTRTREMHSMLSTLDWLAEAAVRVGAKDVAIRSLRRLADIDRHNDEYRRRLRDLGVDADDAMAVSIAPQNNLPTDIGLQSVAVSQAARGDLELAKELESIDFFIEQEFFEIAREALDRLSESQPDNPQVTARYDRLKKVTSSLSGGAEFDTFGLNGNFNKPTNYLPPTHPITSEWAMGETNAQGAAGLGSTDQADAGFEFVSQDQSSFEPATPSSDAMVETDGATSPAGQWDQTADSSTVRRPSGPIHLGSSSAQQVLTSSRYELDDRTGAINLNEIFSNPNNPFPSSVKEGSRENKTSFESAPAASSPMSFSSDAIDSANDIDFELVEEVDEVKVDPPERSSGATGFGFTNAAVPSKLERFKVADLSSERPQSPVSEQGQGESLWPGNREAASNSKADQELFVSAEPLSRTSNSIEEKPRPFSTLEIDLNAGFASSSGPLEADHSIVPEIEAMDDSSSSANLLEMTEQSHEVDPSADEKLFFTPTMESSDESDNLDSVIDSALNIIDSLGDLGEPTGVGAELMAQSEMLETPVNDRVEVQPSTPAPPMNPLATKPLVQPPPFIQRELEKSDHSAMGPNAPRILEREVVDPISAHQGILRIQDSGTSDLFDFNEKGQDFRPGVDSSLLDVFDEFRKSLSASGPPDFETHYQLGTAYKEMMLWDEAVKEFQLAIKATRPEEPNGRFLQCCNMLGQCFMSKGLPRPAALWFQKGLQAPNRGEDEYQAMRYELGLALEQQGELNRAYEVFQEVFAVDLSYRGVDGKLNDLQARLGAR